MANRVAAFAEWRKGIISDPNLEQVASDLVTVVAVMEAAGHGTDLSMVALRLEMQSALDMRQRRKDDRNHGLRK